MTITTRTRHARKTTARKAHDVVTQRLAAVVDADAPAKVRRPSTITPDDTVLALPAFVDDDGMVVFIGEDATILVEPTVLAELPRLLHVGSIKARGGHMPEEEGIAVFPHADALESPTYRGKNGECAYAWRLVFDTLNAA